ncbi:MAG: PQQ-binding-like beta-propeller repeat protein [Rhodothermales bacterium]
MTDLRWIVCGLLLISPLVLASCASEDQGLDRRFYSWSRFEAEPGATSFSALDQIDRSNVDRLQVAWMHPTPGAVIHNPIVVDSLLYAVGDSGSVMALHAGTGRRVWFHPSTPAGRMTGRAFMYWENEDRSDRRLLHFRGSYNLVALDALTGEPIESFGEHGVVDLRYGLGIPPETMARATSSSPGVVFEDLVILGSSPGEGYRAGPGHIRAFDVRTGKQQWIFHTLPQPGEFGYDTWPAGRPEKGGGANAWGGMSVDVERGIVYVPLGSANYDFYGVDRPGQNLFANSLVALDARTGERIWHFQTTHHDLWDYDLAASPVLLTIQRDGKPLDIVAQATKTGMVFAFNRETGEPLWPIEERPVPASPMPGEQAWPTQPFPAKPAPFVPLEWNTEEDLNPYLSLADRDSIQHLLRSMVVTGMYTPPGTRPTLQIPGNRGGANWGSTAGDPRDGTFYVLGDNLPSVLELEAVTAAAIGTGGTIVDRGQAVYQAYCQICHRPDLEGQPAGGIPSLRGVTERLSHVDLNAVIRGGRNQMPAWPQLTEAEMTALFSYLSNPDLALTPGANARAEDDLPERYQSGWIHIVDSQGVQAIKPPWLRLTAYDMNEGVIKWQVPVGEVWWLAEQGITGTGAGMRVRGGPAVTAGGLIFQSAAEKIYAFDKDTGALRWSHSLPGIGQGIPSVYQVDGKQYVVVAVNAVPAARMPPGAVIEPGYMAFALP